MGSANSVSDIERAEHLNYADSKGVKRVSIFNDGVQVNAATEEKQTSIIENLQGFLCQCSSTSVPLGAGATFTGTAGDIKDFGVFVVGVYADVPSAVDGLKFDFSPNGTDWYNTDVYTYMDDGITKVYTMTPVFRYYRIRYVNGALPQTIFHLQVVLKRGFKPSSHRIQDEIVDDDDAELVKSVLTARKPSGVFAPIDATAGGNLKMSVEEFETEVKGIKAQADSLAVTIATDHYDEATRAINVVDYAHHEIHAGSHFFKKDYLDLTSGQVADFMIVTSNTTKWAHLVSSFASEAECEIIAYEGTTTSNDGTPLTAFNHNRNSANTPTVTLYSAPTVTSVGTRLWAVIIGVGKQDGGENRGENEFVLKQNTKYLLRVTNKTVNNNWFDYLLNWYEHTSKSNI